MNRIFLFLSIFLFFSSKAKSSDQQPTNLLKTSIESPHDLEAFIDQFESIDSISHQEKILYLKKIYRNSEKQKNIPLSVNYASKLGRSFIIIDSLADAYFYFRVAYSEIEKLEDKKVAGLVANNFGNFHSKVGELDKALEYYFESISYYEEADPNSITYPLGNVSSVYKRLGDYENAIKYTKEAVLYSKKLSGDDYYYNYGFDCLRLSSWYGQLEEKDSALFYLRESLMIGDSLNLSFDHHKGLLISIYDNAIDQYIDNNDLENAKKSIASIEKISDGKESFSFGLAKAKYFLASGRKKKLLAIINELAVPKSSADKQRFLKLKIKAFERYRLLEKSIAAYKELEKIKEKKNSEERKRYALFSALKFEDLKKQQHIDKLHKQEKLSQLTIQKQKAYGIASIVGLIALLLATALLYFRGRQNRKYSILLQNEVAIKTAYLKELNENLESKNEELRRFNHILSHDLKEPIRSIVSFSNLLNRKVKDDKELKMYYKYIVNGGRQLNHLIDDIQEFQSVEHKELVFKEIDSNMLFEDILNQLRDYIEERNVTVHLQNIPNSIKTSDAALFVILKNIIENGIKYNIMPNPTINVSYQEDASNHQFFIKDNGIGISKEYFNQVFMMFKRLNNRSDFTGSGLGLAISMKFAQRINGRIRIHESSPDNGTTFILTLPKEPPVNASVQQQKFAYV